MLGWIKALFSHNVQNVWGEEVGSSESETFMRAFEILYNFFRLHSSLRHAEKADIMDKLNIPCSSKNFLRGLSSSFHLKGRAFSYLWRGSL
jgi:hypothetical protein